MQPPIPTLADTRAALQAARAVPIRHGRSAAVCALALGLLVGPMALATVAHGPLIALLCLPAALGALMLAVVLHDAAHGSLFGAPVDGALGVLVGVLTLTPFGSYRRGHAAHHRFSGTARDPTPAPLKPVAPSRLLDALMGLRLLPVFYWGGVYGPYLVYDLLPTAGPRRARHLARWLIEIGVGLTLWFGLAMHAPGAALVLVGGWWGGGILYEHLFTFTQHLGLRPAAPAEVYDHRTQTHFARSTRLPLAALVLHFNRHKEHHLAPGLSWQRLPALHAALRARRPDVYRFTDGAVRPWSRRRGEAHRLMSPTVGDR